VRHKLRATSGRCHPMIKTLCKRRTPDSRPSRTVFPQHRAPTLFYITRTIMRRWSRLHQRHTSTNLVSLTRASVWACSWPLAERKLVRGHSSRRTHQLSYRREWGRTRRQKCQDPGALATRCAGHGSNQYGGRTWCLSTPAHPRRWRIMIR
jgi:hypothetical protein